MLLATIPLRRATAISIAATTSRAFMLATVTHDGEPVAVAPPTSSPRAPPAP